MRHIIEVTHSPKEEAPTISICGKWLENFGFNKNDLIEIKAKKKKIILEKTEETEKLTRMNSKNRHLYGLIKSFRLTPKK